MAAGSGSGGAVTGALAALNLLAAVLLTLVLTFFFVKDGRRLWGWIAGLFGPSRRAGAHELGRRPDRRADHADAHAVDLEDL